MTLLEAAKTTLKWFEEHRIPPVMKEMNQQDVMQILREAIKEEENRNRHK